MSNKGVLIAIFIKKNKILSELESLKNDFNIEYDKINIYSIEDNEEEYLATFKSYTKEYVSKIPNSSVMHVKNKCIFSINALNRLIHSLNKDSNVPNNEYPVNWDNYKNKLIILTNNQLNIKKLTKIEDKSIFFND
jgi:hypothetical protein